MSYLSDRNRKLDDVKMNHYTIKDMETLSGIKAHTIRIWEKRYGLLCPERSTTNIRYYSDEELKKLLNVSLLVKHGYKISKISNYNQTSICKEVLKLNGELSVEPGVIDQLIVHMVNFNDHRFEELVCKKIAESGFENMFIDVLFPLLEKVGVFWQTGTLFPAQEHFVSNLLRQLLIRESSQFNNSQPSKTVLFFLKENEQHELSLLFYNYLALKSGYKTIYLGQNVPFEDLMRISEAQEVDYFFSAFINGMGKGELESYFNQLNQRITKTKVFVTGRQIKEHQPLLPRNFKVVPDIQTFKKYFGTVH